MSKATCYTWNGGKMQTLDADPRDGVGISLPDGTRVILHYRASDGTVTLTTDCPGALAIVPLASNCVRFASAEQTKRLE